MPKNGDNERLKYRPTHEINKRFVVRARKSRIRTVSIYQNQISRSNIPPEVPQGAHIFADSRLQDLWDRACIEDQDFAGIYKAVRDEKRAFPSELKLKVSIAECDLDEIGALHFRKRDGIPNWEPLQTALIQKPMTLMLLDTLAVIIHMQSCRGISSGPEPHQWYEYSVEIATLAEDLTCGEKGRKAYFFHYLFLIDFTPNCQLIHDRFASFPSHLTSDRGSNWVGGLWASLCELTKIEQQLSTAFHPETDGSTERMIQEVLIYLRAFISYSQYEWPSMLTSAMLALNIRDTVKDLSPFFLTDCYHLQPIDQVQKSKRSSSSSSKRTHDFVKRLIDTQEYAQAAIAMAQQRMEN
ncbi:hypothetical protein K3495_g3468 [Podosphaera aphanis]|nr:hypothetical protein K3495_g3468 [Podosphaera aphanis]